MEASFFLAFREGLEAFLIVGILLSILDKLNLQKEKKFVWFGLLFGLIASTILAFIFIVIIDGFESEELRYDVTLGILAFAIVMLSYMLFWVQANGISNELYRKIEVSSNQKFAIFAVIFFAVLREGFELILFILALTTNLDFDTNTTAFWTIGGLIASAFLVYLIFATSKQLNLKQVFTYSSYMIMLITAGLSSLLVRGLQGVEYIDIIIDPIYDTSDIITNSSTTGQILGALVGYDATPSLLQVLVFISYILISLFLMRRKNV